MGVIKREIVYSGDILNTIARMMEQCKAYQQPFIVSEEILAYIPGKGKYRYQLKELGNLKLRGKIKPVTPFAVEPAGGREGGCGT